MNIKKNVSLWLFQTVLCVLCFMYFIKFYSTMNILTVYLLLLIPMFLTAIIYFLCIKVNFLEKTSQKDACIISVIFSIINTIAVIVQNSIILVKGDIVKKLIANSKKIMDTQYLFVKQESNLMDYVMIFGLSFFLFYCIGRKKLKQKQQI